MSNVDEILSYKKNPDEDFYALLNCDESSTVSKNESKNSRELVIWYCTTVAEKENWKHESFSR